MPDSSYFSQFGEDRILARIFAGEQIGTCVEVGANNGRDGSTTLHFEQRGWTCVLVEPNPELCTILRSFRTGPIFECGASSENGIATLQLGEGGHLAHAVSTLEQGADAVEALRRHGVKVRPVDVPIRRLDDILLEAGVERINFISIDVEGHELPALQGFSVQRWRPSIIIVEDNSGARDRHVRDHLRGQGYVRFLRTGVNDWFCEFGNTALVGRHRRLRYGASLVLSRWRMASAPLKGALARVPGVLPLIRRIKALRK